MTDRGEKIVSLAREMLRADMEVEPAPQKPSISFKVLCFATILSALGGGVVSGWIHEARRPLTRYERVELEALVFYAARQKNLDEKTLRQEIETRTGVSDFADLTETDYLNTKSYLQSQIP